jgi:hypothetical protein
MERPGGNTRRTDDQFDDHGEIRCETSGYRYCIGIQEYCVSLRLTKALDLQVQGFAKPL